MSDIEIDNVFADVHSPFEYLETVLTQRSSHHEAALAEFKPSQGHRYRLTAFYLPQFHRIPENDLNWGKGFTEWTNVTRSQSIFYGHVQPRLPAHLGFYDLNVSQTILDQAKLAKTAGISAFCFYYYWFNGRKVLDMPIRKFVDLDARGVEFSICWANENWTKRWDGQERDVLINQDHGFARDKNFIYDILPYLSHKSYQKINGRKILLVYRSPLLGRDIARTFNFWREVALKEGVGELLILTTSASLPGDDYEVDSLLNDVDGVVQFPPHRAWTGEQIFPSDNLMFTEKFSGRIMDYEKTCARLRSLYYGKKIVVPGVFPSWDNTPRRRLSSTIFVNSSPARFQKELSHALDRTSKQSNNDGLVFINAWNEWAEGAHLEPCKWYGYSYLNACVRALNSRVEDISPL